MMIRTIATLALVMVASLAQANERYEGYYYPEITSSEEFSRVIREAPPSGKDVRVGFVTSLTVAQLAAPESPRFVFFAKGADARHLIVVALDDGVFSTIYRARAVLAQMSSNLRNNELFRQQRLESVVTFYDLLQFMEFETLVISDGETWAHEVTFVQN